MKKSVIEFKDFSFQYRAQAKPTLNNINLTIYKGEKVLIVGPSGSGKSTLSNCINGLVPFSYKGEIKGSLKINGKESKELSIAKISNMVGTVLQDPDSQFIGLTVAEDIAFKLENDCIEQEEMKRRVKMVSKIVEIDTHLDSAPHRLSGGQKQRVSLAGTLVADPKILILDEPTVGLDPKQITEIRSLIKNLGKKHTVILSSHILSEVSQICDRVIIINKGKIVAVDTPENLEKKVSDNNVVYVTVEDKENKIAEIKGKIAGIKEIKLIKENEDKTKQYEITGENDVNLNKTIFNEFARENITIVEMKKAEATLEDAFMKIIKEGGDK